jgi:hypothetical protein
VAPGEFLDTSCPDSVCPEIRKALARLNWKILFNAGPNRGPVQKFDLKKAAPGK